MAIFKKNKKEEITKNTTENDNKLKDEISKAYDDIMNADKTHNEENSVGSEKQNDFDNEVFKSRIKAFKQERNQQNLLAILKLLQGRVFLLPSVSNMEEPLEKTENGVKLKQGASFNPALLTGGDNQVFLPIFTDEAAMTQKSPSGVVLKMKFEQCVTIVFDEKNPVAAVTINPFTENMVIGMDLLKMIFKEKKQDDEKQS